jgi:hypothetical protein
LISKTTSSVTYSNGNFTFMVTPEGSTETTFTGTCPSTGPGGCAGTITDSGASLTGIEYTPITNSYSGVSNGSNATLTITEGNGQQVTGTYQDASGTYALTGQSYGGTIFFTPQAGLVVDYLDLDGPQLAGYAYLWGFDGSFVGALEPLSDQGGGGQH